MEDAGRLTLRRLNAKISRARELETASRSGRHSTVPSRFARHTLPLCHDVFEDVVRVERVVDHPVVDAAAAPNRVGGVVAGVEAVVTGAAEVSVGAGLAPDAVAGAAAVEDVVAVAAVESVASRAAE